jgi:predicted PurR-regulated permease PerM
VVVVVIVVMVVVVLVVVVRQVALVFAWQNKARIYVRERSLWIESSYSEYEYSWEQKFEKLIDDFWTILHTIMYARV